MSLEVIKFGSFVFPYNPENTTFKSNIKIAKHQYPNINGADLEVLGSEPIEIECSGLFFNDSKNKFQQLYNVYKLGAIQTFSHPLFPDCTKAVMTTLNAEVKAEDDVVHFKFTVIADRSSYPQPIVVSGINSSGSSSGGVTTATKKTYKLQKNHNGSGTLEKIVKAINNRDSKANATKTKVKQWNKQIKNWNGSLKKGTKIYFYS